MKFSVGEHKTRKTAGPRRRTSRRAIVISGVAGVLVLALLAGGLWAYISQCQARYQEATALLEAGNYAAAQEVFESKLIANYRDAKEQAVFCRNMIAYLAAQELLSERIYQQAGEAFAAIGGFLDAEELRQFCEDMIEGMALYEQEDWAGAYECFWRYDDEEAQEWAQKCIQTDIPSPVKIIPDKYRTRGIGTLNITNYLGRDIYFEIYSVTNDELVVGLYLRPNVYKYFHMGLVSGQYRFVLYTGPAWFGFEQKFGAGENAIFAQTLTIDGQPDIWINGSDLCTMGVYETYVKLEKY